MKDALRAVIEVPPVTEDVKAKARAVVARQGDAELLLQMIGLEEQ